MVDSDFITKLRAAMNAFEEANNPVSFFGIFKMDEITDKWTVVVSAPWFDEQHTFSEVYNDLLSKIKSEIGDEIDTIARFGLFTPDQHFIELALNRFKNDDYIDADMQLNGNLLHEGYILKSSPPTV